MKYSLRPYQKEAVEAVLQARRAGKKRLLVCLPTGSGKTVIFSRLVQLAQREVLILAHRSELLLQAKEKIENSGEKVVTIEQGFQKAEEQSKVILCSIRSLHETRLKKLIQGRDIGLIIYDECHHAVADDNARILKQLGVFEPDWKGTLLGFTATTVRRDGLGLNTIFEEIVYSRTLDEMIGSGYLAPLRGYRISTKIQLEEALVTDTDFNTEELAEAVNIEERNALVARTIQEFTRDRRTLIFCVNIVHAIHLAKALNALKHPTGVIHGKLKPEIRKEILSRFRKGNLRALTNIGVLTEGFDDPGVSCIAMARPTRSSSLYLQCVGRGMRWFEKKKDCLILDFVDLSNVEVVSLPSLFGMPRDLNLQGQEVTNALQMYRQLYFDYPGFEIEAGEITLNEIQQRAASFDPLTMEINPEVKAISENAWISLGSSGLALHFCSKPKKLSTFLILASGPTKGSKYQVLLDEKKVAHFSKIEEAVEAVDYEILKKGKKVNQTAKNYSSWRNQPVSPEVQTKLSALKPPRTAKNLGDAFQYLSFDSYNKQSLKFAKKYPSTNSKKQKE